MLTLERIFQAALNDMKAGKAQPSCGNPPPDYVSDSPLGETELAKEYADSGYKPKSGILFANWNQYPKRLTNILERLGYSIEWSDEWSMCGNCYRAIRTTADSYGWRKRYWLDESNGDYICANCVKLELDDYESSLLNNPRRADTLDIDWSARGFTKMNQHHFESGFHPGQNDKPEKIAESVPSTHDYLFVIPTVGQFDVSFDLWTRLKTQDEESTDE